MTELLTRPSRAPVAAARDEPSAALWWRGALAALWAVAVGVASLVVVVLIVWATDSRSGAGAAETIRVALQLWLAAHKVPLHVPGGTIALAPLGLTLGVAFAVARASAVLARGQQVHGAGGIARVAVAVGAPYAALTTFVAAAAHTAAVRPSPLAALVAGAFVGTTCAAWGAARGTAQTAAVGDVVPPGVVRAVVAGAGAVAVLVIVGMLLCLASLAVHARDAANLADNLGGGTIGSIALLALDALLLPNAAVTMLGYLGGPGFAVGAGTSVSLGGAHLGAVPSLPLLAALPHGPAPTVVRVLTIAVLLFVGAGMAAWANRGLDTSFGRAVAQGVGAAAAAGLVAAVAVAMAGGPAGSGRMRVVGASPWQVGLVLFAELSFVAVVVAAVLAWRRMAVAAQ